MLALLSVRSVQQHILLPSMMQPHPTAFAGSQVPGILLTSGAITVVVAAGTVYSASRRLLPQEQRRALDVATGLFALAAAAYLVHA